MATTLAEAPRKKAKPLTPDPFERVLAIGSAAMLLFVVAALVRGYPHWTEAKPTVWAHLLTIVVALALTPPLLLQKRGTRRHRRLGWAWSIAMFSTALISFFIHESGPGPFSPIHLLSGLTVIGVPLTVWAARHHRHAQHRFGVRFTVTGALLIAGFFTFRFGRMLGRWLLG